MKVGIAQLKSFPGDIELNLENHLRFINEQFARNSDLLLFPELSITGYEPKLAESLAFEINDKRLMKLGAASREKNMTIGIGLPLRQKEGITISILLFYPNGERKVYSKRYLHPDEEHYFIAVKDDSLPIIPEFPISVGICYEIFIDEHIEAANQNEMIYMASVAKFGHNINKALKRLKDVSFKFGSTVLMSNAVGEADGLQCAGQSTAWQKGKVIFQMPRNKEGIIIFDTETGIVTNRIL
ncbi:carbon-nitrogen hydrolase family protein [Gracilimonas sp.]|uniref:carbon-nitrogen hydrolase family protein n=1 Tax=Gracilimonas sp. TaxID=1974203 RepID=UPI0032EE2724